MPASSITTPSVSPKKVELISKSSLLEKETSRYEWKGYGLALAFAQVILFVLYWPTFLQHVWPLCLTYMEERGWSQGYLYLIAGLC